eukprot:7376604-Prymnesium_polylepis.2
MRRPPRACGACAWTVCARGVCVPGRCAANPEPPAATPRAPPPGTGCGEAAPGHTGVTVNDGPRCGRKLAKTGRKLAENWRARGGGRAAAAAHESAGPSSPPDT